MDRKGFTLVELAIVLVIIGVILGGVIKGQELVESAKTKRFYSEFRGVQVAFFTYIEKLNALPGDDKLSDPTVHGDGDGRIEGGWSTTTANQESRLFWRDLRANDLYKGSGQEQPQNVFGGKMGVQWGGFGITKHVMCSTLKGEIAESIDRNYDDGIANAGEIRGHSTNTAYAATTNYTFCIALD